MLIIRCSKSYSWRLPHRAKRTIIVLWKKPFNFIPLKKFYTFARTIFFSIFEAILNNLKSFPLMWRPINKEKSDYRSAIYGKQKNPDISSLSYNNALNKQQKSCIFPSRRRICCFQPAAGQLFLFMDIKSHGRIRPQPKNKSGGQSWFLPDGKDWCHQAAQRWRLYLCR